MGEFEKKVRSMKFKVDPNIETRVERWTGLAVLIVNFIWIHNLYVTFAGCFIMFVGVFGPKFILFIAREMDEWVAWADMIDKLL